jgi:amino acid transporter
VGIAMGELGSALPTSGGLYWWTYRFAPQRIKKPLCFLIGYANTLGLIGGITSINYGFSLQALSVPMIFNADFVAKQWQIYLVFVACCISHAIVGSVATKVILNYRHFVSGQI